VCFAGDRPGRTGALEEDEKAAWRTCPLAANKPPPSHHVRFLWRLAFKRLRRLCFDILRRRFFLRLPME